MLKHLLPLLPLLALTSAAPAQLQKRADEIGIIRDCLAPNTIAITFDDGPFQYDSDLLTTLRNAGGSKGTFFVNGNNYGCIYDYADDLRKISAEGHTIGSHTWSHKDLSTLSWDELHDEFYKLELALTRILGLKPKYFRPPYGSYNSQVLAVAAQRGYTKMILWNEDTLDASGASTADSKRVYDRLGGQGQGQGGRIVLNHSVLSGTVYDVIPHALGATASLSKVSVDTCLGDQGEWPYYYIQEPGQRDGSWTC